MLLVFTTLTHSCPPKGTSTLRHTHTDVDTQAHRGKLGLTRVHIHRNTHTHTNGTTTSLPAHVPSASATPQGPAHTVPESQPMPSEPFACKLLSFWPGYLADVDNSISSQQERAGFDGEQVQMVAVSPRCCMETNKPAEIGSLAPAWPCRVAPAERLGL